MTTAREARQGLLDLKALARRDLTAFWVLVRDLSPDQIRDALNDVLPALGDQYGDAAAELAALYFESAREAAGVRGSFSPVIAQGPQRARWEALARWGVDPLFRPSPDQAKALSLIAGGLDRTIADQHRMTIVESSIADPQASGWKRVTRGDSCGFCRMLAGRGGVYTEAGVEFKSHDHCNCSAEASWDSKVAKVIGVPFQYSQRKDGWSDERKARENQRAYDYVKEHFA